MFWDRVVTLQVGTSSSAIEVDQRLRITFDVKKNLSENPNQAVIKVYNLSESTIERLGTPDQAVVLKAGHEGEQSDVVMFVGAVSFVVTYREGADLVTEIEAHDGNVQYRDSVVSLSYQPGIRAETVMRDIATQMGLSVDLWRCIKDVREWVFIHRAEP